MKKGRYFIFGIIIYLLLITSVNAKELSIGDYVYYDPVDNTFCNSSNYWTTANQDTTCYRFLVIEQNNNTLHVMLDHNIAVSTFDNYKNVLNEKTKSWSDIGGISLITREEASRVYSKKDIILRDNSVYYSNNKETFVNGFWVIAEDGSITGTNSKGIIGASNNTDVKGIRPVIYVDINMVEFDNEPINITNFIKNNSMYYKGKAYPMDDGSSINFVQMQGFCVAEDKLFFTSSNTTNSKYGMLFGYGLTSDGYTQSLGTKFDLFEHGNDITYNSKIKKLLVLGGDNSKEIWEYPIDNVFTSEHNTIKLPDIGALNDKGEKVSLQNKYSTTWAVAYDEVDDLYFLANGLISSIEKDFSLVKDSFASPYTEVSQGMAYYNGHIYYAMLKQEPEKCPSSGTCTTAKYAGLIYIYNAKYNSDGTKSNDYGKLVGRLYIEPGYGELESVSFKDNTMYLGFAKVDEDTYPFRVHTLDMNTIKVAKPKYQLFYMNGNAVIDSEEDLKEVSGWELSKDKKRLTKKLDKDTEVNVCDRYNNCDKVTASYEKCKSTMLDDNKNNNTDSKDKAPLTVNVPNTSMSINVINMFTGILFILIGSVVVFKNYKDGKKID